MESSPLTKAHDHAHAAAVATRQASDTTVAISEHTQAAGEFAIAARTTSSVEALRTLKLLEEHHRRLAELLRLPPDQPPAAADGDGNEKAHSDKASSAGDDPSKRRDQSVDAAAAKGAQLPSMGQQRRYASREMSSSIASNLASARGIRSKYRGQPLSPSVSNDQAPGNVEQHPRKDGSRNKMQNIIDNQPNKPAWVPPTPSQSNQESRRKPQASSRNEPASPVVDDGGYARFYNTFGSLINKISAPLAFAGLPLIQEESNVSASNESLESSPSKRNRPRPTPAVLAEPDLSKIYSKATMRALAREGHSTNDSFYVVPTSGHTMSYANILSYEEKEKRRLEASGFSGSAHGPEEEDDDFVDARETPAPLSPGATRRVGKARTERDLNNTIEELCLENKSLKDMLDKLTKRLHAFEASAQNSAMALAESYRIMRPGSPMSGGGSSSKLSDDAAAKRKMQEVEEQLIAATKHIERLEKDNRKMQRTLEKYREKWETLKAGAKARREAQGSVENAEDSANG